MGLTYMKSCPLCSCFYLQVLMCFMGLCDQYYLMDLHLLARWWWSEYLRSLIDEWANRPAICALYDSRLYCGFIQVTPLRKLEKNADALTELMGRNSIEARCCQAISEISDQCGILVRLWTLLLTISGIWLVVQWFQTDWPTTCFNDVNKDLLMFSDSMNPSSCFKTMF